MKQVLLRNISRRIHGSGNLMHMFFTDGNGRTRFGRKVPAGPEAERITKLHKAAEGLSHIVLPDGITPLPEGDFCISFPWEEFSFPKEALPLTDLLKPLEELQSRGLVHLSIDENSFVRHRNGSLQLIFWGDGPRDPVLNGSPETAYGGIPGILSDLYSASKCALEQNWLKSSSEQKTARALCSSSYLKRCSVAQNAGISCLIPEFAADNVLSRSFTVITSGSWRTRDAEINSAVCLAAKRGWACRVLRKGIHDRGRPVPGIPAGTVTATPGQLIQNAFRSPGGIERLLVFSELSPDQADLTALINRLHALSPPGLHIIVTGSDVSESIPGRVLTLPGRGENAVDVPLEHAEPCSVHPVVSGNRGAAVRMAESSAPENIKPALSGDDLFHEGAWRWITAHPDRFTAEQLTKSLLRLGRNAEALNTVPAENHLLKAEILTGMGRFPEALKLLEEENSPLLLSRVYTGLGRIDLALETLENAGSPAFLPQLAGLYDLSGRAAAGITLLERGLEKTSGTEKVRFLCSLRNLEMRLGLIDRALEHAEEAVLLSRQSSDVEYLVRSLQARGRTLQVTGRWKDAQSDFRTAVLLSDESVLSMERPAEIDLLDIELRMGHVIEAVRAFDSLDKKLRYGGALAEQMMLMLKAHLGSYLGSGEKALPHALKAEELASGMGLELYRGISTLYAGKLNVQAGNSSRGMELLKKAMSIGHILGDRHLVCLAEIELLISAEDREDISSGSIPGFERFPEEHLMLRVIMNEDRENSISRLLDLPSPFTACRLADRYGLPEDRLLRDRLHRAREAICSQMSEDCRADYLSTFTGHWVERGNPVETLKDSVELIKRQSIWIADYCEGVAGLEALGRLLDLDEISTEKIQGAIKVSDAWPLYIAGSNAEQTAPFLLPAAAVTATLPEAGVRKVPHPRHSGMIGESEAMERIRGEIGRFAPEDIPILLTGETGTGKELCAREIHEHSRRSRGNFVPVDCGAIPENLMESELFGAAAGAYTGISASREGLLAEAAGGTLFLDEIGNLPLLMQVKLLRALDSKTYRRLGETGQRHVDVRIVSATNSTIDDQIRQGAFRSDLFYRISAVRIHLPPLRERIADLAVLAAHFAGKPVTPGGMKVLTGYTWPGNVRELQNVMRRASITAEEGVIRKCDIILSGTESLADEPIELKEAVKEHIRKIVERCDGNRAMAARLLQCDPKTIRKYLSQ